MAELLHYLRACPVQQRFGPVLGTGRPLGELHCMLDRLYARQLACPNGDKPEAPSGKEAERASPEGRHFRERDACAVPQRHRRRAPGALAALCVARAA
jgi:hypothetical protein